MRQNKMIMRSLVLLGALFFWGNSFAQISLSVNKQTIKQIIPQIEKASGYNVFYTDKLPNRIHRYRSMTVPCHWLFWW
jgi:hypothetical protein